MISPYVDVVEYTMKNILMGNSQIFNCTSSDKCQEIYLKAITLPAHREIILFQYSFMQCIQKAVIIPSSISAGIFKHHGSSDSFNMSAKYGTANENLSTINKHS